MHPHLHMLASFALVDLAQHANFGERLCKQANADLLSKLGPAVGGVGGGLLGAGVGGGLAKLLQGTPENEEEESANRRNMILAALAGGGLGAVGGSAAGMSPLVQDKLKALGQNPEVQDSLAAGGALYGDSLSKVKALLSQLGGGAEMDGIPAPPDVSSLMHGKIDPFDPRAGTAGSINKPPTGVDAGSPTGQALAQGFQ